MKIEIEKNNALLKRKEVKVSANFDSNPGKANALKEIAKHFKKDEALVVINKIESNFGAKEFVIDAFIFNDNASREKFNQRMKTRKQRKEKK